MWADDSDFCWAKEVQVAAEEGAEGKWVFSMPRGSILLAAPSPGRGR